LWPAVFHGHGEENLEAEQAAGGRVRHDDRALTRFGVRQQNRGGKPPVPPVCTMANSGPLPERSKPRAMASAIGFPEIEICGASIS